METKSNQKGITLVALVITIIILLILAGISISALTNTGLFEKAKEAQYKTENAQAEENAILDEYAQKIDEITGGSTSTGSGTSFTNVDTSKTNPGAAMPARATVIESDANKGIVIKDSKNNEWVWIEVPKTTVFKTATSNTDYDNIKTDLIAYATDYRGSYTDEYYEGCGIVAEGTKTAAEVYAEMYNKMLSSVYTNGGFWISRYEAGIKGSDTDTSLARTTHTDITDSSIEAVSQANQIPYNYIYCSEAQTLASKMSTDSNKTSSLLFGIQWDLVCKFLEVNGDWDTTTNTASYYIKSNSASWGNYYDSTVTNIKTGAKQLISSIWTETTENKSANSSILLTTGASEYTNKMNIYDFAGNEYEWTLEHATSNTFYPCAVRGGSYGSGGSGYPASSRDYFSTSDSYSYISFRSALY